MRADGSFGKHSAKLDQSESLDRESIDVVPIIPGDSIIREETDALQRVRAQHRMFRIMRPLNLVEKADRYSRSPKKNNWGKGVYELSNFPSLCNREILHRLINLPIDVPPGSSYSSSWI